jgi:hypothetical protein
MQPQTTLLAGKMSSITTWTQTTLLNIQIWLTKYLWHNSKNSSRWAYNHRMEMDPLILKALLLWAKLVTHEATWKVPGILECLELTNKTTCKGLQLSTSKIIWITNIWLVWTPLNIDKAKKWSWISIGTPEKVEEQLVLAPIRPVSDLNMLNPNYESAKVTPLLIYLEARR